jgi:hypothetical protein
VQQVRRIITELQELAKESGHDDPLLIGMDQENGRGISDALKFQANYYNRAGLVSAFSRPTAGTQLQVSSHAFISRNFIYIDIAPEPWRLQLQDLWAL